MSVTADQVAADPDAVDLGQVPLDVARRQPARVEREDLVVEALEATLPLPDDLRLEAALPVTWRLDLDRAVLGRKRLRRRAVARVAGAAGRLLVRLVAEMLTQLRRHVLLLVPGVVYAWCAHESWIDDDKSYRLGDRLGREALATSEHPPHRFNRGRLRAVGEEPKPRHRMQLGVVPRGTGLARRWVLGVDQPRRARPALLRAL